MYDREKAVSYAHRWAYSRNPIYYNFDDIGGDCTNFASQCIFAGAGIMNYKPVLGWYYTSINSRTPSWSGVVFLHNFLISNKGPGPRATEVNVVDVKPGDIAQLSFNGENFAHSPVVISTGYIPDIDNIKVAAHTYDTDNKTLSDYYFKKIRFLHITS